MRKSTGPKAIGTPSPPRRALIRGHSEKVASVQSRGQMFLIWGAIHLRVRFRVEEDGRSGKTPLCFILNSSGLTAFYVRENKILTESESATCIALF